MNKKTDLSNLFDCLDGEGIEFYPGEGSISLYQGDCIEVMKTLPSKSISIILTDPPYGTTANRWDSVIDFDMMWKQIHRLSESDRSPTILFSNQPFTSELIHSNLAEYSYSWIWKKDNVTGFLNASKQPLRIFEDINVFYKKQCFYNPQKEKGFAETSCWRGRPNTDNYGHQGESLYISKGERFPTNILEFKRDKEKLHPTQKPVDLLLYLLRTYYDGGTVLDFTMGSGSTGVACKKMNIPFVGVEKDSEIFNLAKERIENV